MQHRDEEKEPAVAAASVHKCKTGQKLVHAEAQTPYASDLDYLEDHLAWFKARYRWKALLEEYEDVSRYDPHADDLPRRTREAQAQERVWRHRIECRLQHTRVAGTWQLRAEQLAGARQLTPFEKHILLFLTGLTISSAFQSAVHCRGGSVEVGTLLNLFWDTLEEQITARRHFYREAPLVQNALIDLDSTPFQDDFIIRSDVRIDRRMVDYIVGLETEATALVEGSHLYRPTVDLARVVLPEAQKRLIVETVAGFPAFQQARRRYFDSLMEYGRGLVLLFWGPSGSGKTMMANALASHLGKRLLLVNYPKIGQMTSDQALKFLFREARIHDAVLFFDECDGIFESRERHNTEISLILSEIERHEGLIIMATNRPTVLDEAMHRRITLAVEFRLPDAAHRAQIWRTHLPPDLPLADQLDLTDLASRYELSGGLIKNAVLAALALATARDPVSPCLYPEDLEQGTRLQMRSQLRLAAFEACTMPQACLDDLIVPPAIRQALHDLIGLAKVRCTLINDWGFTDAAECSLGATALFSGPPGTGKSLAAEAVAYELGRPLRRVNVAQVTSKWVGETAQNLAAIFQEARQHEAVLVFEEADALFAGRTPVGSATDRYANLDTAVLLREMERFPGVVILTSNLRDNIDDAFRRRLRFTLAFPTPERVAREALWRQHIPARMPLAPDVSCAALAAFPLTGAQIRNAVLKAAARAVLRPEAERQVTQTDLAAAAEEEARITSVPKVLGFTGRDEG
jgi:SpoVK/Ycf46/Vps4 family AAA+-type ATPase